MNGFLSSDGITSLCVWDIIKVHNIMEQIWRMAIVLVTVTI